jgi:SAM-dependent methyltransferase
MDDTPDGDFYRLPRLVAHIDPATIEALTAYYAEVLADADAVLDLMSSWISHLPVTPRFSLVAGLGMNEVELATNSRLGERVVQDLNADPLLPFEPGSFDAVLNAVSVQYLTRPVEVFSEVARVLRPGGLSIVAMSHRCFPTKAIRAFHVLPRDGRLELVSRYHALAGGFEPAEWIDRSPEGADPLWIVAARRAEEPAGSSEET